MSATELFKDLFRSKVDSRGRIYLPKKAREKLSVKAGDKIYLEVRSNRFIAYTTKAISQKGSALGKRAVGLDKS